MRVVVEHNDGRRESFSTEGENFTLGLGGTLFACICGERVFAEPGPVDEPDDRQPDRLCGCGRQFWFYEDEAEQQGFLH